MQATQQPPDHPEFMSAATRPCATDVSRPQSARHPTTATATHPRPTNTKCRPPVLDGWHEIPSPPSAGTSPLSVAAHKLRIPPGSHTKVTTDPQYVSP